VGAGARLRPRPRRALGADDGVHALCGRRGAARRRGGRRPAELGGGRPIAVKSPTFFRQPRVLLTLPSGRRLRVVDIHPLTPGRTGIDVWEDSLSDLPATGDGVPWILLGDFNATLDHSRLREVLDRGYRDAGSVAGMGLKPTWPNRDHDLPPVITIDHVLADERLDFVHYGVEDLPGSDHRSIHAELALP